MKQKEIIEAYRMLGEGERLDAIKAGYFGVYVEKVE